MNSKPSKSVVRTVRWPESFDDIVNGYCHNKDRTRNWLIKKAVAVMLGLTHAVSDTPEGDEQ